MDFDVKIINGLVFDGSGNEPTHCDIGINGDLLAEIGDLSAAPADVTIDADGLFVCPGFVDAHSHSDTYLLLEPSAASKVYQGITTEVCGNCGASAAPLNGDYKMPSDWLDKDYAKPWKTIADYRERFAEANPAINVALLVGHNTLHAGICGYEPRAGTPEEMKLMKQELEQALDEGAIGISSGLAYPPVPLCRGKKSSSSQPSLRGGAAFTPPTCVVNPADYSKRSMKPSISPNAPVHACRFPT
jgi:N-acyl-D-amino-acid deacylase